MLVPVPLLPAAVRLRSSSSLSSAVRSKACVFVALPGVCPLTSCDFGGLLRAILLLGLAARHSGTWGPLHGMHIHESHLTQKW